MNKNSGTEGKEEASIFEALQSGTSLVTWCNNWTETDMDVKCIETFKRQVTMVVESQLKKVKYLISKCFFTAVMVKPGTLRVFSPHKSCSTG